MKHLSELIYDAVPGGQELVQWFGGVPSFHDAEILSLNFCRNGQSSVRLHGWIMTAQVCQDGHLAPDRHAVVTFLFDGVMDLQLDGFSHQNVIMGLILRRAPNRPERHGYLSQAPLPDDIEIEIESCFGISGLIRARSVSIAFAPGKPDEIDKSSANRTAPIRP